ncbi:MAG TPA: RlpA-like double-psi beta-barrel domain-containing protein [Miltoncostaeaceae bacterium]|nr:RlpA-like double-psi beta-barrel domain-containing protein [Miltoncostaeaceae bacterium]
MPRIRPRSRPSVRIAAIAVAALACWSAGTAAAAPTASQLRDLRSRLDAQDAALVAQLDAEQATLSGGRARLDRARDEYAAARRGLEKRLVALYVMPQPSPVIEILTGADIGEVQARIDLLEALGRSDRSLVSRYRASSVRLRIAESGSRSRKDDLTVKRRALAAERRDVALELRAAEKREAAAARAAEEARAAALPVAAPDPGSATAAGGSGIVGDAAPSPTNRGLSPDLLDGRGLPGQAPVDAASGEAVDSEPAPDGPPLTRALPGLGVVGPATGAPITGALPTFTAVAGWYGADYANDRLAGGEAYDPAAFSAAHRTLRLGTMLRVAYGGKAVTVKVNDRGPYVKGRDLLLSQAAAAALGIPGVGTVTVQILPAYGGARA